MDARERAQALWDADEKWDAICIEELNRGEGETWIALVADAIRSAESEAAEKARREALEEVERILAYAPPGYERADFFKAVRSLASSPGKESAE